MTGRMGAPVAAGLAATALVTVIQVTAQATGGVPTTVAVSDVLACSAFIWCGVVAWRRRPGNPIGALLLLGGVGLSPVNLMFAADAPVLRTIGLMGLQTFAAPLVHLLVAFPGGRLRTRGERLLVGGTYFHVTVQWWAVLLFYEPPPGCTTCLEGNLLGLFADRGTWDVLWVAHAALNAVVGASLLAILLRRHRTATPAGRRAYWPVLAAGALVSAIAVVTAPSAYGMVDGTIAPTELQAVWALAWWALPASVLLAVLRTRASRFTLGELVERLARRPERVGLRAALADALGDPSLEVGYWVPEVGGWRDADGRPLAARDEPRATTELVRDGHPQAILVFDPVLLEDDDALEAVRAAAGVAIDMERLQAELRVQLADVRAAQARVVDAADTARRRIERELRAGPQRRLLDLAATLAMVDAALPRHRRDDLAPLVQASTELAQRVREELRDLAAGVFPEALQTGGLPAALQELASLSPLPVALELDVDEQLPEPVAAAAWFACREAIANAAKHSGASGVRVRAVTSGGELLLEVTDDGEGGARADGTGLRGLADRMAALGGRFEVRSGPRSGTTVRAVLPVAVAA